jgi:hypothetical protein
MDFRNLCYIENLWIGYPVISNWKWRLLHDLERLFPLVPSWTMTTSSSPSIYRAEGLLGPLGIMHASLLETGFDFFCFRTSSSSSFFHDATCFRTRFRTNDFWGIIVYVLASTARPPSVRPSEKLEDDEMLQYLVPTCSFSLFVGRERSSILALIVHTTTLPHDNNNNNNNNTNNTPKRRRRRRRRPPHRVPEEEILTKHPIFVTHSPTPLLDPWHNLVAGLPA